jgi:hypothetical protein
LRSGRHTAGIVKVEIGASSRIAHQRQRLERLERCGGLAVGGGWALMGGGTELRRWLCVGLCGDGFDVQRIRVGVGVIVQIGEIFFVHAGKAGRLLEGRLLGGRRWKKKGKKKGKKKEKEKEGREEGRKEEREEERRIKRKKKKKKKNINLNRPTRSSSRLTRQ